jgi:hypothetical protein
VRFISSAAINFFRYAIYLFVMLFVLSLSFPLRIHLVRENPAQRRTVLCPE